jgi:hypothetical protein
VLHLSQHFTSTEREREREIWSFFLSFLMHDSVAGNSGWSGEYFGTRVEPSIDRVKDCVAVLGFGVYLVLCAEK